MIQRSSLSTESPQILAALVRMTRVIAAGRDLDAVFETLADELAPLFPYDRCSIGRYDPLRRTLVVTRSRGTLPVAFGDGRAFPIEGTAGGWVIANRRPLIYEIEAADRFQEDDLRRQAGLAQAVFVPIMLDGEPVGCFSLSSTRRDAYRPVDLWILETIADHLGLAMAATSLRQEAERRAARAQFLSEIAALFATSRDVAPALREALIRASASLGDLNAVFLFEEETGRLGLAELSHPDPAIETAARDLFGGRILDQGRGLIETVARGEPLLVPTVAPSLVPPALRRAVESLGVRSALTAPLRVRGQLVGVFASARVPRPGSPGPELRPFTPDDLELARELAAHLAGAIVNARLHAATKRALDESEALRRIGQELATSIDLDEVLTLVATFAQLLLGADYAAVAVNSADGADGANGAEAGFAWRGVVGNRTDAHTRARVALGEGTVGRAVANRAPVVIEGFPDNPRFPPEEFAVHVAEGARAALGVPLAVGERVFGALIAGYRSAHTFKPGELRLAAALAGQAAIVAENARLFAEAQRAIQHRDEFVSIAAHELRTPLTTLKGRAQLLQRRLAQTGSVGDMEAIQVILRQLDRLSRMVNDLLDVSRIDAGRLVLAREPTDLVALVGRAAAETTGLDRERALAVETDVPKLVGEWDPWRLEQVLANLFSNALRYSPPETPVRVRVYRWDDEARVDVVDGGIGIAADDLERIFERYYRGDPTTGAGIGLGLAICRQIVADHGGRLWATSPGLGQGATFTVSLPL